MTLVLFVYGLSVHGPVQLVMQPLVLVGLYQVDIYPLMEIRVGRASVLLKSTTISLVSGHFGVLASVQEPGRKISAAMGPFPGSG